MDRSISILVSLSFSGEATCVIHLIAKENPPTDGTLLEATLALDHLEMHQNVTFLITNRRELLLNIVDNRFQATMRLENAFFFVANLHECFVGAFCLTAMSAVNVEN